MKKNVIIGSLVATVIAFGLYSMNIKRVNEAQVHVVEPKVQRQAKKKAKEKEPEIEKSAPKEPKVDSVEYSNHVKIAKGSQTKLAKKIKKVMGIDTSYQVAVQDLTNSAKFARVANSTKTHDAGSIMKMYVLLGIFAQEQKGKLTSKTTIKVTKADKAKGEKNLRVGMTYGVQFLRQAMMKGNKTAANALIRKVGKKNIEAVAQKLGADNVTISSNFDKTPYGKITAKDLTQTMVGVYQGRALNRTHASRFLAALMTLTPKTSLVKGLNSASYSIGDSHSAVAIVQAGTHAYAISVWSQNGKNFEKLGATVHNYFVKKH